MMAVFLLASWGTPGSPRPPVPSFSSGSTWPRGPGWGARRLPESFPGKRRLLGGEGPGWAVPAAGGPCGPRQGGGEGCDAGGRDRLAASAPRRKAGHLRRVLEGSIH